MPGRQTLAGEIKERKAALRDFSNQLKALDTQIEAAQRLVARLRGRKTKLPNLSDLDQIINIVSGVGDMLGLKGAFNLVVKGIELLKNVFTGF